MAHAHPIYDTNKRFVIDAATRNIAISDTNKPVLIQYDNYSEVITFEVDRYVEGHDLSLSDKAEIHYNNLDAAGRRASKGLYVVEDLKADPDNPNKVLLTWRVSEQATKYEGTLNFVVSFSCLEDDISNVYRWNSHIGTFPVSAGINNTEHIEQTYADVLEMWKETLFGIGDTEEARMLAVSEQQQAAIETKGEEVARISEEYRESMEEKAKQLLSNIPDEYEALQSTVNSLIEDQYIPKTTIDGNAITETYNDGHYKVTTVDGDTITENWYSAEGTLTQTKTITISQKSVTENFATV